MSDLVERPSDEYEDVPTVHALTDDQLQALIRGVARAAYRGARYRGRFNGDQLEPVQRRVVDRKATTWFEQNKGEYL